jgi:hypothetical protein
MADWETDFFHMRLKKILQARFKQDIEIYRYDADAPQGIPYIAYRFRYESGDPYGGYVDNSEVELIGFTRSDGTPMKIKLVYSLHGLSGQMDDWTVTAEGVADDDLDSLRWVLDVSGYRCFQLGNYIRVSYTMNGNERESL